MKNYVILFLLLALSAGCKPTTGPVSVDELYAIEKEFSFMSQEMGMVEAFLYYCHDEGVMLTMGSHPVVGKDSLAARLSTMADSLFTLTWTPTYARIAASGELGYTYGKYQMQQRDSTQAVSKGTYVTIWAKDDHGKWKFLLDTGQDGPAE